VHRVRACLRVAEVAEAVGVLRAPSSRCPAGVGVEAEAAVRQAPLPSWAWEEVVAEVEALQLLPPAWAWEEVVAAAEALQP
jgi:hypothetical protein